MVNLDKELGLIRVAAAKRGLDPLLIAAIRLAENGPEGREFGVMLEGASTYQEQLDACCATVRNLITSYSVNPFIMFDERSPRKLMYSKYLVAYIGRRYAPINADNDPSGLNHNWIRNVWESYLNLLRSES